MTRLLAFDDFGFSGNVKEYRNNDPNLELNGDDFELKSAIVLLGSWNLYDSASSSGTSISLTDNGGPESDGAYKDFADWNGASPFLVKSISHS